MIVIAYLYMGLLGACIGSFLSVLIHRLPRRESVIEPRSCCPQCGTRLAWYHLVPVWSYLHLRGRCGACRAPIPPLYLLLEIGTALLFAGLFHVFGWTWEFGRYAVLVALLIAAAEIDRRHGIIPDRLVVAGAGLGLALVLVRERAFLAECVPAAIVSAGILLLVRIGSHIVWGRAGLGMGDVKLAAMMSLFLGWEGLWVFYLAVILGGAFGLLGLLTGRLERTTRLPLAPFVAVGTALHLLLIPPSLVLPL